MVRPEPDHGDGAGGCAVLDAAGQVVVQIEQRGSALLFGRQMKGLLRVLKKDVRVIVRRAIEVEEAEGQLALGGTEESSPCDAARRSPPAGCGKEDCDARNE